MTGLLHGLLATLLSLGVHGIDLAHHDSPYLREHAADAIHWLAPEADPILEARRSGRPLLVSSGYLSCYWCHRLKLDTFNNRQLAELVNDRFVPVLFDREMHGVDDQLLQAFMQRTRGFGGWPLVAILTPEGEPVQAWPYMAADDLTDALARFDAEWQSAGAELAAMVATSNRRAFRPDGQGCPAIPQHRRAAFCFPAADG